VITGKKVYVQGFEIHGASYPAVPGCGKWLGIIDRDGGVINEDGFSFEEIRRLF
jgi:hypothetical protein